jgi:hypothetical protein
MHQTVILAATPAPRYSATLPVVLAVLRFRMPPSADVAATKNKVIASAVYIGAPQSGVPEWQMPSLCSPTDCAAEFL